MRNLDPTLHIFHHASIPMTSLRIAALSSGLLLSACSSLGPFKEADANQDGAVSREEAARSGDLTGLFTSADDNQDGVLNEEEYELARRVILGSRQTPRRSPSTHGSGGGGGGHSH